MLAAHRERAVADQQHMRCALHDEPGGMYRVARPEDASNRAGAPVAPIHYRGVHLLLAGCGEDGAAAGIEQRVVLERRDRRGRRIERGAAACQHLTARGQCPAQPGVVGRGLSFVHVGAAQGARAAMHGEAEAARIAPRIAHPISMACSI